MCPTRPPRSRAGRHRDVKCRRSGTESSPPAAGSRRGDEQGVCVRLACRTAGGGASPLRRTSQWSVRLANGSRHSQHGRPEAYLEYWLHDLTDYRTDLMRCCFRLLAAVLLVPHRDSDAARASSDRARTSCLCTGCNGSGRVGLPLVVPSGRTRHGCLAPARRAMREPGLTSARTAGCCFSVEALGGRAGWSGDAVGPARTAKVPSRAASQRAAADRELLADRLAGHGRVAPGGHSESRCRGRRGRAPGWWRRGRRSRSPRRRSASGPPTGRRRAAADAGRAGVTSATAAAGLSPPCVGTCTSETRSSSVAARAPTST